MHLRRWRRAKKKNGISIDMNFNGRCHKVEFIKIEMIVIDDFDFKMFPISKLITDHCDANELNKLLFAK